MGCATSKLDDLPAVALCRDRCHSLDEAIHHLYAFADAHLAYIHSLERIGLSLHHFFGQDLDTSTFPHSPVLSLPTQRKGDPIVNITTDASNSPPPGVVGYYSHSNSSSHLHFHSDSDDEHDEDDDAGSLHHSGNSPPLHSHHQQDYRDYETLGSIPGNGGFMSMNFMRNRATPSVVYEQQPVNAETLHMGESSSASSYYPYSYPNQNPTFYPSYDNQNYGGSGNESYLSSPPVVAPASPSTSKPPPPPPSPPRNSAWDFFNPFDTIQKYDTSYTPSRNSKDVREEEGIPDLEDEEDYQEEVVKEVYGDKKFVDDDNGNYSKMVTTEAGQGNGKEASVENDRMEYEVHLMGKVGSKEKQRSENRGNVAAFKARAGSGAVSEVVREIKVQFKRASDSGSEVAKMLDAGKMPYHQKNAVSQVSSKMLHVIAPSLSVVTSQLSTYKSVESSSSAEKAGSVYLDYDENGKLTSRNLSSTLHQLYIWEKKLYDEVKAEEKMRIAHDRKCRRLKRLEEKGAEAHKVDSARTLIRNLSTKIRIAIQVVDKISVKINKLRDEELWPQISELIHRLFGMWKVMLECHKRQSQAIAEAKSLDAIASNRKLSDVRLKATMQLELELLRWILSFSIWIEAQKGYVRALNSWLLKCLLYEPEETPDGIAPFSPGRIGAPPVFVICNQWSQAMERISEKEVVNAVRVFAMSVLQLWDQHNVDLRMRMMANKDMESEVKALEREEQKMQKAVQAIDKKIVLVSGQGSGLPLPGQIVHQSDTNNVSSLQLGLKKIFEALERFNANSMQVYEDLWARSEEDRHAQENSKVP